MTEPARTILLVDDEPALLKMMGLYLRRKGHVVIPAENAEAARQAVEAGAAGIAAAVFDGSMRGLSSEELALRLLAANPAARVIMASGYPVDMSRLEAAGPGRVEFLQKPFSPETLDAALRRMIASSEEDV